MITILSWSTNTVQTKNGTQQVLRMNTQEYPNQTVSAFAGAWSQGLKAGDKVEGSVSSKVSNGKTYLNFKPENKTQMSLVTQTNNSELVSAINALTKAIQELPTKLNVAKVFNTTESEPFSHVSEDDAFPGEGQ